MKTKFLFFLFLFVSLGLFAQETDLDFFMQQRNEYYFSFNLNGNDNLARIAKTISVDRVDENVVTAYANNKQFVEFQKLGYEVTLLTPPSMLVQHQMFDGRSRAEYDWDQYPTYDAYESMMYEFQTDHPDKCEIINLGTLPSGRKILIAHINNGNAEGKPKFLYTSTIHGDETTGWMLMLRLIDYILENPTLPEVQNVIDNMDLYVGPLTNPDGTYHGGNNTVNGATRNNANGVDMNRNYPDNVEGPHPDGNAYQTETQWFMQFAEDNAFVMGANYHGGAEVVNYPWDNTYTHHVDDAWYQLISREYADLCHEVSSSYLTYLNNGITYGADWYMIGGGRQDYMNAYAKCREVTIECSNTKCPSGNQMPTFWNYNKESIFAFMNQCLYGIHGIVTDAATGQPLEATVTIVNHDQSYSIVESHLLAGDYHRPIKAGTYTVKFAANGYYPVEETVTVADNETLTLNVQLEAGEGVIADFSASTTGVSIGGTVDFTDNSWGAGINSWNWEFEGATPSTSTAQNPTGIRYDETGNYGVRLTVTNANGDTDTKYIPNYINVVQSFNMHNGTVTTCGSMFYDDNGPDQNYSNSLNLTLTILPEVEGAKVQVEFISFVTESGYDILKIYDGESASATMIGQYSGTTSPGTVVATNAAGALTFVFTSDSSVARDGWVAYVNCLGLPIELTAEAEHDTICESEQMSLFAYASGGSGEYTYSWSPASNLNDPSSATPVFTADAAGSYSYTVTVSDGSQTESATVDFVVVECQNVEENETNHISLFPNPASSTIYVVGADDFTNIEILLFNLQGQMVKNVVNSLEINVEDVESGIYFIKVNCDGKQIIKKIVVD